MSLLRMLVIFACALLLHEASAQTSTKPKPKPKAPQTKWDEMDVGPFFSYGLEVSEKGKTWRPALKGITIKLGGQNDAAVCFDTERLRLAVGWRGGFLKLPTGRDGLEGVPQPIGDLTFRSSMMPGWAGPKGEWVEPVPPKTKGNDVCSFGPLPRDWAKWRGLYVHGQRVVLSYSVGAAQVLESHDLDAGTGAITRSIEVTQESATTPLTLLLCQLPGAQIDEAAQTATLLEKDGNATSVALAGARLKMDADGNLLGVIEAKDARVRVVMWRGPQTKLAAFHIFARAKPQAVALSTFTKGGQAQWGAPLLTKGQLGTAAAPYVVDTITIPEDNPVRSWIRCSGFDFFKDGTTAAICSVTGDVWLVSGIDDTLQELKWKRFATGLFQPLGLKVVGEKVYVLGRDQITRLHDLNNDGEADFYENFNNDVSITNHYHEYCLSLETDTDGNFYFIKGGNLGQATIPHHGCLLRVSKDGLKLDSIATGHRAPNGLGVGPANEITSSDNEGNWVPTSRINWIKPGGFYGHVFTAHREPAPTDYDKPLCWLPHQIDNSSGGQVWVAGDKWGPFKGDLLHMSYGRCKLLKVFKEEVEGQVQGGVVELPLQFDSGIMRGAFNPRDGQLYLCGLRVWQSSGARYGAFHRVRYTGKAVHLPAALHVRKDGLEITFTTPLDPTSAVDDQNYAVDQWNYQWSSAYGSKLFSAKDPARVVAEKNQGAFGGDVVEIKSIMLSEDKKTVLLKIPDLKPVMQSRIRLNLKAADGTAIKHSLFHTINRVPK
ncbi:MAG: hypothetical protein EXS22_10205 [Pedosphaera sp.]|nr:hypothetical protein [Pedosphaera sp.]MSU44386.1 hypothetical protein [Pedosphaera sp.]